VVSGLETTFETLAQSDDETRISLLLVAIDSPHWELQQSALRTLLLRRNPRAEAAVLSRWRQFSNFCRSLIADRGDWIAAAVREAIARGEPLRFACACEAASATRDYDLIAPLATVSQDSDQLRAEQAAATVLELAERLYDELSSPRNYRVRRDPQLQRAHALVHLEKSLATFPEHGRIELVEAFLLLANRDNAALKRTLQATGDRSFATLARLLCQSSRPGVVRLLLAYLDDPHAPLAALQAAAQRQDVYFLRQLFRRIASDPAASRNNLKRIDSIAWMREGLSLVDSLSEAEQAGVLHLAVSSGIPREQAYHVTQYMLQHGKPAARAAAAAALAEFRGPEADALALSLLGDAEPQVRANVIRQLRDRGSPGAFQHLLKLVDSSYATEREAARACLDEYHFDRFLTAFDSLSVAVRYSTGALVRKVDPQTLPRLRDELRSPSRSRRKRGLEIAIAVDAVAELHDAIAAILHDEDQYLRLDAVRVLATSDSPRCAKALRQALLDTSPLVQAAAQRALRRESAPSAETVPMSILHTTLNLAELARSSSAAQSSSAASKSSPATSKVI
jgi:HEAT repeat protein